MKKRTSVLDVGLIRSPLAERASSSAMIPCGRIWPSGDFGLGYRPRGEVALRKTVHTYVRPSLDGLARVYAACQLMRAGVRLGLSVLVNSHTRRKGTPRRTRGELGISAYGRKMLGSAARIIEQTSPRSCVSFLTLTLPPMELLEYEALVAHWAELVRTFLQWLSRRLSTRRLSGELAYGVELQTRRWRCGSPVALHLHVVFQGRKKGGSWVVSCKECRNEWASLLRSVLKRDFNETGLENLQRVERSAAGYLSKYISKGSDDLQEYVEEYGPEYLPSSWWGCSLSLKRKVKKMTITSESAMAFLSNLLDRAASTGDFSGFKFAGQITVDSWDGLTKKAVGWYGTLDRDLHLSIQIRHRGVESA